MATIKLTTWNIEHFGDVLSALQSNRPKLEGIAREIEEIAPDILCVVEGPGNLPDLVSWVQSSQGLRGRFHVVMVQGTEAILQQNPPNAREALKDLYGMQGNDQTGNQWIWFLVRDGLFQDSGAVVLDPHVWRDLTAQSGWRIHDWGSLTARRHSHWRQPQTMTLRLGSVEVEIIGVHLKSKINKKKAFDTSGNLLPGYADEALRARIRLATEAYDVRAYIERRFQQDSHPRIFVCGDMNDGPGKGYFEREFLYFDLVSNIQGDVFFARRFLNHALFDFDDSLRWTANFHDKVEGWSRRQPGSGAPISEPFDSTRFQLLDHILFTQPLVGDTASPRVEAHSGLVEHTIHQRTNATLSQANRTSDHVPVSIHITL